MACHVTFLSYPKELNGSQMPIVPGPAYEKKGQPEPSGAGRYDKCFISKRGSLIGDSRLLDDNIFAVLPQSIPFCHNLSYSYSYFCQIFECYSYSKLGAV